MNSSKFLENRALLFSENSILYYWTVDEYLCKLRAIKFIMSPKKNVNVVVEDVHKSELIRLWEGEAGRVWTSQEGFFSPPQIMEEFERMISELEDPKKVCVVCENTCETDKVFWSTVY